MSEDESQRLLPSEDMNEAGAVNTSQEETQSYLCTNLLIFTLASSPSGHHELYSYVSY